MAKTWDVAIVGGGVMGSSIAYHLAKDPGFSGRILVIERDPTYGACATTRSWGGVRQQFSNRENIQMGLYAVDFVRRAHEILAVEGEDPPDLGFKENGYLFLASERGRSVLEANHRLQSELGAETVMLEPGQIAERFPWINPEGLAAGCYGTSGEGWIDPSALLHAFRRKAISLGVTYLADEVVALERDGGRITGLETRGHGRFACGLLGQRRRALVGRSGGSGRARAAGAPPQTHELRLRLPQRLAQDAARDRRQRSRLPARRRPVHRHRLAPARGRPGQRRPRG